MQPFAFPMEMMGVMAPPQRKRPSQAQMMAGASKAPKPGPKIDNINVMCNNVKGTFMISSQTIICRCISCTENGEAGSRPMSPTEFERHSGMQTSKKWRRSIKVDLGPGNRDTNKSIGRWLEENGYLPPTPPPMTQPIIIPGANGMPMMIVPGVMGGMQAAAYMQQQMAAAAAMSGYPGAQMFAHPGAAIMGVPPVAKAPPAKKQRSAAAAAPVAPGPSSYMLPQAPGHAHKEDHDEALLAADALNLLKRNEVSSDDPVDEWAPPHSAPPMAPHPAAALLGLMGHPRRPAAPSSQPPPPKESLRALVIAQLSRAPPVGGIKPAVPADNNDDDKSGDGQDATPSPDKQAAGASADISPDAASRDVRGGSSSRGTDEQGEDVSQNLLFDHGHRGSNSHRVGNQRPASAWYYPAKVEAAAVAQAAAPASADEAGGQAQAAEGAAPVSGGGDAAAAVAAAGQHQAPDGTDAQKDGSAAAAPEGADAAVNAAEAGGADASPAAAATTTAAAKGDDAPDAPDAAAAATGEPAAEEEAAAGRSGAAGRADASTSKEAGKANGAVKKRKKAITHMAGMQAMPGLFSPHVAAIIGMMPGYMPSGLLTPHIAAQQQAVMAMPPNMLQAAGLAPGYIYGAAAPAAKKQRPSFKRASGGGLDRTDDDEGGYLDRAAPVVTQLPPGRTATANQLPYFPNGVSKPSIHKNDLPVSKEAAPRVVRPRMSRVHKMQIFQQRQQQVRTDPDTQDEQDPTPRFSNLPIPQPGSRGGSMNGSRAAAHQFYLPGFGPEDVTADGGAADDDDADEAPMEFEAGPEDTVNDDDGLGAGEGYTAEEVAEAAAVFQQSLTGDDADPESVPRRHNGMAGTRKMRKPANKRLVKLALQPMMVSDVQELDNGNLGVRVLCPYGEFHGNVEEVGVAVKW